MEWRLFATLAEIAGRTTVAIDPGPDPTVGDALDALLAAEPDIESQIYNEDGNLYDHVRLLVDGSNPFREGDGLDEPIDPDTELALMPAVSGG